jgi:hypothetical protein
MKILSIDIGIINLGYVYADVIPVVSNCLKNKYYQGYREGINIIKYDKVDITNVLHTSVSRCNCTLYHESCIPDYVDHFIQENALMFDSADIILIERQPPVGITNVQDLLFTRFRKKVIMISPNTIHAYFSMSKDYDIRKQQSEKIANEYITIHGTRKHDIADALLMLIYRINKDPDLLLPSQFDIQFEKFRYIKY